jgi:argininosuccinate lyase
LIGQLLREADRQQKPWTQISLADLRKISPLFGEDFLSGLSVENALASKKVPGGTSEASVRAAIAELGQKLKQLETEP